MKKSLILLFVISGFQLFAQQEAQFTQYMDNMQYYNPAYAGSREMLNLVALHRQQWAGFSGAPISTSFSLNTPLKYESLGVGISVLNDHIGPVNATWINGDFSYSLRFKKHKGKLSFGLKAGINLLSGDIYLLSKQDQSDPNLNISYNNKFEPNIGAGIYYHSDKWFIGVASPKIIEHASVGGTPRYFEQRHYYLTVGGYFRVNRMLKLRPSFMFKVTEQAPFAADGSLAIIYYDRLWLGGNYRLGDSGGVYAQYQISKQFKVGYAFEMSTTALRSYHAGTHELLISYDLNLKGKSLTTPRYF